MAYDASCEIFRINKQLCSFSQDGRFLAVANQVNLHIKNTGTFDNYLTFVFPDIIEEIEWSPDSEYVLCYSIKKVIIQIFSVCYPEWKFKLIEGSSSLESVTWTPDSKNIVVVADLKVQLCIWSLIDHSVTYIPNLKSSAVKGVEFSSNGKYLAVIVSENGQDNVDIYKTKDWKLSRKLICEGLIGIDGICWSPNSEIMCLWCAVSGLAKMIIYSTVTESYEAIFHPDDHKASSKNNTLSNEFDQKLRGLEMVKWIPSGQLLAVSGHNETVILLNSVTWNPILQLRLEPVVKGGNYLTRVFKECIIKESRDSNRETERTSASNEKHILEEVGGRPVNIPIVKNEPLIGGDPASVTINIIDIMEFSSCGQYLSIRHKIYPGTLWIWDLDTKGIDVIIFQNVISGIKWDPVYPRLLAFTESPYMFEWTPNEISCLSTPRGMAVLDARWHPSSNIAALCGYNRAMIHRFNDR